VHGGRRAHSGTGREQGRGQSNERRCGRDGSVDRAKSPDRGEVMSFTCDSTDHRASDLKCLRLALKSRAAIHKRAEFLDASKGALNVWREKLRKLQQLRNEKKAHFCMLSDDANAEDMGEGCGLDNEDEFEDKNKKDGFAAVAVKSFMSQ